jgi:hypothetical protein
MKASPSTAIAVPCMWRGGSCHDFISYIDVDDPEPAQTCRRRLGSVTLAQLARPTKSSEETAWQMQLRRTWMHHQVRRTCMHHEV